MGLTRTKQRLAATAAPFLHYGERIEHSSIAMVGSVPVGRTVAVGLTAAVAAAVLTGGAAAVYAVPAKQYVVLTNHRLLFFAMNGFTGRPSAELVGEFARSALTATPVRGRVLPVFTLIVPGSAQGLKLRFPLPARHDAHPIAAALQAGTPTAVAGVRP